MHNKRFFIDQLEILRNLVYHVDSSRSMVDPTLTKVLTQIVYMMEKMIYNMESDHE